MEFTRYLGLSLPVRTATLDGKAINQDLSGLAYSCPPSIWDATTDPTAIDDSDHGYYVGARWLNTITNRVWMLLRDTPGTAFWQDMVQAGADLFLFGDASDSALRYNTGTSQWEHQAKGSDTWGGGAGAPGGGCASLEWR